MKQYKLTIINNNTKEENITTFEAKNDTQAQRIVNFSFKLVTNKKERKELSYILEEA